MKHVILFIALMVTSYAAQSRENDLDEYHAWVDEISTFTGHDEDAAAR